jgi:ribonuclease P protein component
MREVLRSMKMKKENRLRNNRDFRIVYDKGKSFANRYLVLFIKKNSFNYNRVGFAVTKKLGKAVVRNKVKRRMREAYKLNSEEVKQGYDIIFLSRISAKEASFSELKKAEAHLLKKAGLLQKGE